MGKMNDLEIVIREFAYNDQKLENEMRRQIMAHLDGDLPFQEMDTRAQAILEAWETDQTEEIYGSSALMRDINQNEEELVSFSESEE